MCDPAVRTALEGAHRSEWAGILAATVRVTRDLGLAEECVQDAYSKALLAWERQGTFPTDLPHGWLGRHATAHST